MPTHSARLDRGPVRLAGWPGSAIGEARAAGVGKGTVFHRFGDRAGLVMALVDLLAWHQHATMLIAEARPGDDAPVLAHLLLAPLAAERAALRHMALRVLDEP